MVLPHPRLLLFGSWFLLLQPGGSELTLELLAGRPRGDCDEVSWYGIVPVGVV
jgi:hypothetical protein